MDIITALITPYNKKGEIDFSKVDKLMEYQIMHKAKGVVLAGTTGEGMLLDENEMLELFHHVAKKYYKDLLLILNVGMASTNKTIAFIKKIESLHIQCDAYMIIIPYYLLPSFEGIYSHFLRIAEVSSKPLIVYDIPKRTGKCLKKEELLKILQINGIIGIKEARPEQDLLAYLVNNTTKRVYAGNDSDYWKAQEVKASGIISVMTNVNIDIIKDESKRKMVENLIAYLNLYPNPYGIKKYMNEHGEYVGLPRAPLDKG